jgi:predicted MFS family arabinose efflux permease
VSKKQVHVLQKFSGYQKFVIAILVFLQFTVIFDFMVISPLGAVIMPALSITPSQFGLVVSAYAFSAGIAGMLAAGIADKYDRKKLLLFFYSGFIIGTLFCGIVEDYKLLLAARIVTGLFGGVIGSIVLAITVDLFAFSVRGRVMGFIQTAFAASQVLGLPAGLLLSNHFGWHAPFILIAGLGAAVGVVIVIYLKPVDGHLKLNAERKALQHLVKTITTPRYLLAFSATALLSLGGYMLMPFASVFLVNNVKVGLTHLPIIYFITGAFSILIGPLVGRASDAYGKFRIFVFGTVFSIIMVVIYTNMGVTPLYLVIVINVLLFVGIFSRMIPSQALTSAMPEPAYRGSFMSISASMQQVAGGFASVLAGFIVIQHADNTIGRFNVLGYIMVFTMLTSLVLIYFIDRMVIAQEGPQEG